MELTAADVGARPNTWMPTAEDVGARPDTWMPDGLIYQITAQALEEMNQEQQEALYTQGYRAIKATNNGTVVLLGLESDGSLSWIGCNQDTRNLLDNPNFAIAQAGYGGTHGTQVYAADRWIGSGTGATFAAGSTGGLVITCGTDAASVEQVIANPPLAGEYFSLVVVSGEDVLIASGAWTGTEQDATETIGAITATVSEGNAQILASSGSATIDYCALLRGSYTPKTLTPWKSPDHAAELEKCRFYFKSLEKFSSGADEYYNSTVNFNINGLNMRITPTVGFVGTENSTSGYYVGVANGGGIISASISGSGISKDRIRISGNLSSGTANSTNYIINFASGAAITISADL